MKASTNMSLLAIASWLMLLAPPTAGAAKLRRRQAERRNLQQQELLGIPPDRNEYADLEVSTVYVDKKSNKGSKHSPNSEDISVLDFAAWDELVYAYAAENYNGDVKLLDKYGWNDLVDLWSDQPNASKQPPRSKEETIAAQERYMHLPPAVKENLPEAEKTPPLQSNITSAGDSQTATFALDVRRMNADNEEAGNRVHNGMYYSYAMYDFTAAEGTMPLVVDSVSDHSSSATDGALHIKPRPNSLPYGQFGVGIGTHDPQYDLHVAGITEIDGDLIVKGRIFYYDAKPKKLDNKKKGETYENEILPNRNRFDEDDDDDDDEIIGLRLSGKEGSTLEKQFLDLQDKYQELEGTVQQLIQRIDILEGKD